MEKMKNEISKIELSKTAKQRILQTCRMKLESEQESRDMKKKFITNYKKPLAIVAMLAVCFCLTGITALAATGKMQGFFRDVKRFDGAITGTTYQNATDEILVSVAAEEDVLVVTLDMLKPEKAPYSEIEVLELKKYRVLDAEGTVVLENIVSENAVSSNNQVNFRIPAERLLEGSYKLKLDALSGSKKADADILIYGNWECEFTK